MKTFARSIFIILLVLIGFLAVLSAAYLYSSLSAYNTLLVILMAVVVICIIALGIMGCAILYANKTGKAGGIVLVLVRLGLATVIPVAAFLAKPNSRVQKSIRKFYVELNNIAVASDNKKYRREDILLLLPHCIQNSDCSIKVTNDPYLCRNCGKCKVGILTAYAKQKGIGICIATGGTAARSFIKKLKPRLIVSVACERDLVSGISDVRKIPVIGINNRQPNGACFNTDVEFEEIKSKIEEMTL